MWTDRSGRKGGRDVAAFVILLVDIRLPLVALDV